jgi:hypothetical protein
LLTQAIAIADDSFVLVILAVANAETSTLLPSRASTSLGAIRHLATFASVISNFAICTSFEHDGLAINITVFTALSVEVLVIKLVTWLADAVTI